MDVDPKEFVDHMYRPRATPDQVEAALEAAGFFNVLAEFHPAYRQGGQEQPDGDGHWAVIFFKNDVTAAGARQEIDAVLDSLGLRTAEGMETYAYDWSPDEPMQRSGTFYLPGHSLVRGPSESEEIDPKGFIEKTHREVADHREVEIGFEAEGFSDVNLVPVWRAEDPYWMIYATALGDQARVEAKAREVLSSWGLYLIDMKGAANGEYWTVYMSVPFEQINTGVAEAIVDALLEDVDAELPSHKSEVRILPTKDPRRFDVTLLTGFEPIYIGTLGHQGSLWKPVEVMPGVGRQLRSKLHFVGPDKEAVAMTMVQALRPIWKRQIDQHLYAQLESEEIDPKNFADRKVITYDIETRQNSRDSFDVFAIKGGERKHVGQVIGFALNTPDEIWQAWPVHGLNFMEIKEQTFKSADEAAAFLSTWTPRQMRYQYGSDFFKESDDEVDPKEFAAARHFNVEGDIKRIIETSYPNIEVIGVENKTGDGYSMKYEAQIRSRNAGQPLWHSPIYNLIQDIEVKLADVYGWKLRPYKNQKNYPEFRRTGKAVGIKPIGVSYNNTGTPGVFVLYFDFAIMRRSPEGRGDFDVQADWGTPYGSPGEQQESSKAEIEKEAAKVEAPASPEQAEAGNYRKGHVSVQGLEIAIENAEGSTRSGTGKDGKKWSVTMPAHYGYLKGTEGKDKDHLDVYIGPKPGGMMVFVVNQRKQEGGFDEHKIMLGFETKDEAIATYDRAFSGDLGPKLRETVVSTTVDKLKEWLASGNTKKPFEGLAESLLEAEDEFGLEDFKALAMRAGEGVRPGTTFHIGFAIRTSAEHEIEMRAVDDNIEVDWEAINAAIPIIERNALTALGEQGIQCRAEGHSDDELVGSAWVEAGTGAVDIIKEFVDTDEPFRTSSGNIDHIQQGLGLKLYQGVPETVSPYIDVDISFFELDAMKKDEMDGGLGLGESDEIDPKATAMRTETPWREMLRKADSFPERNEYRRPLLGFQLMTPEGEFPEEFSSTTVMARQYLMDMTASYPELLDGTYDVFPIYDGDLDEPSVMESDEVDPKATAMRTKPSPTTWGALKPGDVIFSHETGSYERIEGYRDGYGQNYQDASGRMVYDGRPVKLVLYSQFGPAYAYGHFVQRLSSDPRHALLGAELVDVPDNSDEALWKLVDEEIYRHGTTPEELEQSRASHRARQAAEPPERADARRRMADLMGLPPPQNESDEIDPKEFVGGHSKFPVTLVPLEGNPNAWRVIRNDNGRDIGALHYDLNDDAPTPEAAAIWKDQNWFAIPLYPRAESKSFPDQDSAIEYLYGLG